MVLASLIESQRTSLSKSIFVLSVTPFMLETMLSA